MKQLITATSEEVMRTALVHSELGPTSAVRALAIALGRMCSRYGVPLEQAVEQARATMEETHIEFDRNAS